MSFTALVEQIDGDTVKIAIDALREIAAGDMSSNGDIPNPQTRLAAAQTLVNYANALR